MDDRQICSDVLGRVVTELQLEIGLINLPSRSVLNIDIY